MIDAVTLRRIVDGEVTVQFRRWKRPTVKAGGTLLTAAGVLAIDAVEPVTETGLSTRDAKAAGFEDLAGLERALAQRRREGDLFRISLRYAGPDPRVALRAQRPDATEMESLQRRLEGYDARSPVGPWVRSALEIIRDRPETRAADLAEGVGMEKPRFKANIRKLKSLGLTESLEIGYRLSPRGHAVLEALTEGSRGTGDPS